MVVISAAVVNTGAGKKMEKKNSLDGLALTRQTVAIIVGDGGTTVVINAKPGAGGLSQPSMLGLEGGWTPTLVVVVLQSSTLGLERKWKRKTYLMGQHQHAEPGLIIFVVRDCLRGRGAGPVIVIVGSQGCGHIAIVAGSVLKSGPVRS